MQRANWISTLAVLSHEGGYLLAYLYDNYYLQPNAYNELVEQVQRYDPSYTPESDSINWYNARELSDYLFELQHAYVALHGSSCTADFDLELYNESVAALSPHRTDLLIPDTPYSDPNEGLFPDRDAYDRALRDYASYTANGGTLSFLDWLARVYWGDEGSSGSDGNNGGDSGTTEIYTE